MNVNIDIQYKFEYKYKCTHRYMHKYDCIYLYTNDNRQIDGLDRQDILYGLDRSDELDASRNDKIG